MPPGRSSTVVRGVLLLGALAAVTWVVVGGSESGPPRHEASARGEAVATLPVAPGPALSTVERVETPQEEGLDPSTGLRAKAEFRFVIDGGGPAAGVRATYQPLGSQDPPLAGRADVSGRMAVHASAIGQSVLLQVSEGPGWAAEGFVCWAVGSSEVVLAPGCQVWLVLRPAELDLVGKVCTFDVDGYEQRAEVRGQRTLLGSHRGSACSLRSIGSWWVRSGAPPVLLPAHGSVEIAWEGEGGTRIPVRFQSPAGVAEVPRVLLSPEGGGLDTRVEATATGPDWMEFPVAARGVRYLYAASCSGHFALGRLDPQREPIEGPIPPRWLPGCRLEVLLPDPGPVLWARAYVASEPERAVATHDEPLLVDHVRLLQDPAADWIDFGAELVAPACREWPVEADVTRSRIVWSSVPRGRVLRIVVAGTRLGTLSQNVTIPPDASRHDVRLAPTTAFTVEVQGARTALPGEEEWISVACLDGRGGTCTVLLPREQSRVVIRGFPVGETARVTVSGGGVAGEAQARVTGDLLLPVVLHELPRSSYAVKVVDEAGHPVGGVGVRFTADGWGSLCLRTDESGVASRRLGTSSPVEVQVADERFTSAQEVGRVGVPVVLRAARVRVLRVEFDVGTRLVGVTIDRERGGALRDDAEWVRVVAGSVLTRALGARDETRIQVEGDDGHLYVDRIVPLSPDAPTTLRVTR